MMTMMMMMMMMIIIIIRIIPPLVAPLNLILPETRVTLKIYAADDVRLSLLVFTQLFSKNALSEARQTSAKTEFNAK